MIKLKNINKKFKETVIKDFSFDFNDKGIYAIIGDSGSGKSTLLNIISGVDNLYSGEVKIGDINVKRLSEEESSTYRLNHIGYVFQDFRLLNLLSVFDNVLFNLDAMSNLSTEVKNKMVNDAINFAGLNHKKKSIVNKLSGGEKQRVALARAIVTQPKYLLCDEPTGNLDDKNAIQVFELIKKYSENHTVILVSHDEEKTLKYADTIIYLKDGDIQEIKEINKLSNVNIPSIKIRQKEKTSLSFKLRIRTGLGKIKEKKWRSLFTNFVSSLSLLALGISVIVTTSLKDQIINSFSNVIDENQIIVTKKGNNPNPYISYMSASEEVVNSIAKEYDAYVYGMGVSYLADFDSVFADRNQVYFYKGTEKKVISSFFAEKFNDYIWSEEKPVNKFYPAIEKSLGLNDIVFGLPYAEMISLSKQLGIGGTPSFEVLGTYLKEHPLDIYLGIDNLECGYVNDLSFHLKSVYPSTRTEIFHTNHLFNYYVFEQEARLPSTLDVQTEVPNPLTLKKVYSLHLSESPHYLVESIQFNKKYDDILLENSQNYLEQECIATETCERNVMFAFLLDKNAFDISDIISIKKVTSSIDSYYFSTISGYQMHASGMVSGFSNNIAFSLSMEKAEEMGDFFAEEHEGTIITPPGVALGGITYFNQNSVLFSSDINHIKNGRVPNDYNEIVVSTGLIKNLGYSGDPLFENLYYSIYSSTLKSVITRKFKIVGVVEEEKNYLYHLPMFTISFFRDKLGVSSFNLIPTSVVINLKENTKINLLINDLSNAFREYNFSCPLNEIGKSVDEVMNYVTTIALTFSLISLIVTLLLLALISYLNALESENEINLLKHIGHSKRSIQEYIVSHSLVMGIITTIIAIFEIVIVQLFLSKFLRSYFGVGMATSINVLPIFIILIVGLVFPILISTIITKLYLKK